MAFSLFGKKEKSVLGVDIGAGGIKIVEFKPDKKRPLLHTYAYTERTADETGQSMLENSKTTAGLLKKLMKQGETTTIRAVAGLPVASVFSSIISVPASKGKELKAAIEWQAKKLIPLPLEEMVLDWKILEQAKKEVEKDKKPKKEEPVPAGPGFLAEEAKPILGAQLPKKKEGPPALGKAGMRVLITGAAKNLVEKYKETAKEAGLELRALETEAYALIRALIGKDPSTVMLIDFGTLRTSLIVVRQGIPFLTRSISLGGVTITRAISKTLGIPEGESEQMKRDIEGLGVLGEQGKMPAVIAKTIEPLITEARYSMGLYTKQQANAGGSRPIEKIILTGGSSHLPYLAKHIETALNVSTFRGDPWARVSTHEDLRGVLDEVGPRFAVAIGLAMRDFE